MTEAICSDVPGRRSAHGAYHPRESGRTGATPALRSQEGFDKTFLKRHFKNVNGNLYDGVPARNHRGRSNSLPAAATFATTAVPRPAQQPLPREPDYPGDSKRLQAVSILIGFLSLAAAFEMRNVALGRRGWRTSPRPEVSRAARVISRGTPPS